MRARAGHEQRTMRLEQHDVGVGTRACVATNRLQWHPPGEIAPCSQSMRVGVLDAIRPLLS